MWSEFKFGLSLRELNELVVTPFNRGAPILIEGRVMPLADIDRITIKRVLGTEPRLNLVDRLMMFIFRPDDAETFDAWGQDVTEEFISSPPREGYDARHIQAQSRINPEELSPEGLREVFVVHGRNLAARDALFEFLRAIDLHPLEWTEASTATGKPAPYIGEILDAAFSKARAVVVLFTPDDEARLKQEFRGDTDPPHETEPTGQARPNVLFEAGMAMGRHPDRTVLVELGNLRPFSDIAGLHVIRMDGSSQRRQELAQRLGTAGCPVKLDGTDWHTAGDFGTALAQFTLWPSESPDVAEQISSASDPSQLSEEANELLSDAAADNMGMILVDRMMGGVAIKTNGKGFGEMGNRRSEAKWEQAINDLIDHGFVEDREGTGEVFNVTHRGFQVADGILQSNHEA